MPGAKHPRRWAPLLLQCTGRETEAERGRLQPAVVPWGRGGANPALLAFQGLRHPPSRPLPTSPTTGRRRKSRAAGLARGGHPQEAALFLELRFKETQDAKLSPSHCGRCHGRSLAHSWEERGRTLWTKGLAPRLGLQVQAQRGPCGPDPHSHCSCWKFLKHAPYLCS